MSRKENIFIIINHPINHVYVCEVYNYMDIFLKVREDKESTSNHVVLSYLLYPFCHRDTDTITGIINYTMCIHM